MEHWLIPYIGKPYSLGGRGPEAYDCWGFVQWVLARYYGFTAAAFETWRDFSVSSPAGRWIPSDRPQDGAVAFMDMGGCPHVGIWADVDLGGVAHCLEPLGVIFTALSALASLGCHDISFYRFSQIPQ